MKSGNVFSGARWDPRAEVLDEILSADGARIERIVSSGQASTAGEWCDQESPEVGIHFTQVNPRCSMGR